MPCHTPHPPHGSGLPFAAGWGARWRTVGNAVAGGGGGPVCVYVVRFRASSAGGWLAGGRERERRDSTTGVGGNQSGRAAAALGRLNAPCAAQRPQSHSAGMSTGELVRDAGSSLTAHLGGLGRDLLHLCLLFAGERLGWGQRCSR